MKAFTSIALMSSMALLASCETVPKNIGSEINATARGVSVFKEKKYPIKTDCFYQSNVPVPGPGDEYYDKLQYQYVAVNFTEDGRIRRMAAKSGTETEKRLAAAEAKRDDKEWIGVLSSMPKSDLENLPLDQALFSQGVQRDPGQLDLELHYNSRLAFVLMNEGWVFDDKFPFLTATGVPSNIPPFYENGFVRSSDKRVIALDYFSDPKFIPDRNCIYDYELRVEAQEEAAGRTFSTKITIDPGGKNGGGP